MYHAHVNVSTSPTRTTSRSSPSGPRRRTTTSARSRIGSADGAAHRGRRRPRRGRNSGRRPEQGAATAMSGVRLRWVIATCALWSWPRPNLSERPDLKRPRRAFPRRRRLRRRGRPVLAAGAPRRLAARQRRRRGDRFARQRLDHPPAQQPARRENTPAVIAFDSDGAVVHAWGGPGEGYDWGTQTHGIHVDHEDNVWVGFGGGLPYDLSSRATTDNAHVLKFTPEGGFLLQTAPSAAAPKGAAAPGSSASRPTSWSTPRATRSTSATAIRTGA